jgi:hypothetical protein
MTSSPITDEKLNGLWLHRHDFTEAEWAEIAPILLGTLVAMRSSAPAVMGMEEVAQRLEALAYGDLAAGETDDASVALLAAANVLRDRISTPLVTGRE